MKILHSLKSSNSSEESSRSANSAPLKNKKQDTTIQSYVKTNITSTDNNKFKLKKTLTKPERNNLDDPNNANYHYTQKIKTTNAVVLASTTGFNPFSTRKIMSKSVIQLVNNKECSEFNSENMYEPLKKLGRNDALWIFYCYLVTFWVSSKFLKIFGLKTKERQMAWREKIALISIIFFCGIFITFLTFGFNTTFCKQKKFDDIPYDKIQPNNVIVHGLVYNKTDFNIFRIDDDISGKDISFLFQNLNGNCKDLIRDKKAINRKVFNYFPCTIGSNSKTTCINSSIDRNFFYNLKPIGSVIFTWDNISQLQTLPLVVYEGNVININILKYLKSLPNIIYPVEFDFLMQEYYVGYDVSLLFSDYSRGQSLGRCLVEIAKIGTVDSETVGCVTSKAVLSISLILITSVIVLKFLIAIYYAWVISPNQGVCKKNNLKNQFHEPSINAVEIDIEKLKNCQYTSVVIQDFLKNRHVNKELKNKTLNLCFNIKETSKTTDMSDSNFWNKKTLNPILIHEKVLNQPTPDFMPFDFPLLHTICFVTCYSESQNGIKSTLDSVCKTDYPNSHKLLMVVCDGLITGTGNNKSTPDLVLEMISDFTVNPDLVKPHSYVAVSFGSKRHNMAKVYSGFYTFTISTSKNNSFSSKNKISHKIPIICIVKCGTADEQKSSSKPGNRGKRDSQVILMAFLEKVFFNDRMSELEYQILKNIWMITGLMARSYELVLTIDADTVVFKDSLKHMVAEMCKDPEIMGLCGETRIENKLESWVTAIQVFEYFISHHQSKAFETVFTTVTCLPGCFSMYRIKSPKKNTSFWVPILANPDIVERYSDNVTNSLHKKNLLQLGEDRFLTSLLLKTFPKRKQIFVSKAICKTLVPSEFQVLLSQRRRWINSTIHNLMELLLVNDLCGVFCFSMQFLILIELIGSLVLPLAITFTIYVIMFSIFSNPTPYLTLILLAVILGLPGVLILFIGANYINFLYMIFYIIALPIWNFVLPVYAFWKFDDFSWGETRLIEGDDNNEDDVGMFDSSKICMKYWREMAKEDSIDRDES
ncbi:hypothetical protein QEN19_004054 [Hanseniaspora menglaensis]